MPKEAASAIPLPGHRDGKPRHTASVPGRDGRIKSVIRQENSIGTLLRTAHPGKSCSSFIKFSPQAGFPVRGSRFPVGFVLVLVLLLVLDP